MNSGYGHAMHYRQVEVFKAIMDSGSITEAANILRISQPAVSKALKLLEAELGLRLFARTTKGIAATEEARLLYTEVERTYFGMQNLARFAAGLSDRKQGRIVVSTIPALGIAWLPAMVARFSEAHPDVTIALESDGQHPRTIIDASLGLTICALAAAGCGVGIVDSEAARMRDGHGLVFRSFRPAIRVPIFLFRQRGRPTSKLVETFIASLKPPPPFRSAAG
ncbi:LysR family transcriptional regulator [Bosea sp. TAB14]|uniref:LysR family transcriptional regulator n=1 Tax=Bosea sp. TAB14 TaxID=3237481 RepID=UPI003F90926C